MLLRLYKVWVYVVSWSLEVDFEDLPLLDQELSLGVSSEGEAGLGTANVFAIVIADRELCVGAFFVAVIHNADIAAAENGSFVRVVGDGELC